MKYLFLSLVFMAAPVFACVDMGLYQCHGKYNVNTFEIRSANSVLVEYRANAAAKWQSLMLDGKMYEARRIDSLPVDPVEITTRTVSSCVNSGIVTTIFTERKSRKGAVQSTDLVKIQTVGPNKIKYSIERVAGPQAPLEYSLVCDK